MADISLSSDIKIFSGDKRIKKVYAGDELIYNPITADAMPFRTVWADLDMLYDPGSSSQQNTNINIFISRMTKLQPLDIYLQNFYSARDFNYTEGLYFPNRHLPEKGANLFNTVVAKLRTACPNTRIFGWIPILAFIPTSGTTDDNYIQWYVTDASEPDGNQGILYKRLSPFNSQSKQIIKEIYEDFAANCDFDGINFHDDGVIGDYEDMSPAGIAFMESLGVNVGLNRPPIANPSHSSSSNLILRKTFSDAKIAYMNNFTLELISIVKSVKEDRNIRSARDVFCNEMFESKTNGMGAEEWIGYRLQDCLNIYDRVGLEAYPYMEGVVDNPITDTTNSVNWFTKSDGLIQKAKLYSNWGKFTFILQALQWDISNDPVPNANIITWMNTLKNNGASNWGYCPDMYLDNVPDFITDFNNFSLAFHQK